MRCMEDTVLFSRIMASALGLQDMMRHGLYCPNDVVWWLRRLSRYYFEITFCRRRGVAVCS